MTIILSCVCISLIFGFNELKKDYRNLRNSIDSMNVYVNNRVNSIVSSVEDALNSYSSLSTDYSVTAVGYDNNLKMKALYKPKTMSLNTQAIFHCKSKDESFDFEAVLNDDAYFEADINCPLSNYIEISIEIIDIDIHNNEIIRVYYGLYNASFGDFDIVWPFEVAMDKENILEKDCRVLRHDTGDNEFGIEMAEIVKAEMKLYKGDELICEYDNSGIDLSSDEYVFIRPEGIKVEIDKYLYREVLSVTDEYNRVLKVEQRSDGIISVLD
ncbi:MAG: hypothetical protein ACI4WM_07000 [Erysipelotrichaceae bacterium]